MKNKNAEQFKRIAEGTKEALCGQVDAFFEQTPQGCYNDKAFLTMEKLEDIYLDMMAYSQASYIDMIGRTLSSTDETKLLELKKDSTRKAESY